MFLIGSILAYSPPVDPVPASYSADHSMYNNS